MKTLTAQVVAALSRLPLRPVTLVKIEFTKPTAFTAYFTDRPHYEHNGQDYLGRLLSYSDMEAGNVDPLTFSFTTGGVELTFNNNQTVYAFDTFSAMLYHPTANPDGYVLPYARVTVSMLFEDTEGVSPGVANELVRFIGYAEPPTLITNRLVKFNVSDVLTTYDDRLALFIVSNEDLPIVNEDDIGKAANIIYGSAREVPTIRATTGGSGILLDDIPASGDIVNGRFRLSNCSRFSTGGGNIVIGDELLTYTTAVCREDSGEVGSVAITDFSSEYTVFMPLVRSYFRTDPPPAYGDITHIYAGDPQSTIGSFESLVSTSDDGSAIGDSLVWIAYYRRMADNPGTNLSIFITGYYQRIDLTGPTVIDTGGCQYEILELQTPASEADLLALNGSTNAPVVLSVLATGTLTYLETRTISVPVGSAQFIGIKLIPFVEYADPGVGLQDHSAVQGSSLVFS